MAVLRGPAKPKLAIPDTIIVVQCPICSHALEGGELVMVCSACHKHLGEGLAMSATGEFRVPSAEELEAGRSIDLRPADGSAARSNKPDLAGGHGERPHVVGACSWCGKLEPEVKKLLGRNNVALCDECVSLACDIMDAELGETWR